MFCVLDRTDLLTVTSFPGLRSMQILKSIQEANRRVILLPLPRVIHLHYGLTYSGDSCLLYTVHYMLNP